MRTRSAIIGLVALSVLACTVLNTTASEPTSRAIALPTTQVVTTRPSTQPATQPVTTRFHATDRRALARVESLVAEYGLTEEQGRVLLQFPDEKDEILRIFAQKLKENGVLRARKNPSGSWSLSDKRVIGTLNDGTQVWAETLPTIPPLPPAE